MQQIYILTKTKLVWSDNNYDIETVLASTNKELLQKKADENNEAELLNPKYKRDYYEVDEIETV